MSSCSMRFRRLTRRVGHDSHRHLVRARSRHRAGCAVQIGRDQLTHTEGTNRARGVWNITIGQSCLDFGKLLRSRDRARRSFKRKFVVSPRARRRPLLLQMWKRSKGKLCGCRRCVGTGTLHVMPHCWSVANRAHTRSLSCLLTQTN